MRRLIDEIDERDNNIIIVKTFLSLNIFRFSFDDKDTILSLKQEISKTDEFRDDTCIYEMCFIISENYPYELMDNLKLKELLKEHRILNLIVREKPEIIIPKRLRIKRNMKYLEDKEVRCFEVINFRDIYDSDIEYISLWMDSDFTNKYIEVDCLHSKFVEIMSIIIRNLDESLEYGVQPNIIRGIVFYNYDNNDRIHYSMIEEFNKNIKTEENKCYRRIKLIDYSTKNIL